MRGFFNPIRTALLVLSMLTLVVLAVFWSPDAAAQDWASVTGPVPGAPQVVGGYANACLTGAQMLPAEGVGYQAVNLHRRRYYGHPVLVDYVQQLGHRVEAAGFGPVLVGDLAQPRGGPMPYGHSSHQSGLDVDIWFRLDLPMLERSQRSDLEQPVLVDHRSGKVGRGWTARHAELVHLAATDDRVARIFVDAAIKRDLCGRGWDERSWLRKMRPWPKHDAHMHVRLHCPADSAHCIAQDDPPPGEGCAELEAIPATPDTPSAPGTPRPRPPLPLACAAILEK